MKQTLFEGYPDDRRIQALEDNCDQITKECFLKRSTAAEKEMWRKRNAELDIELGMISDEEKESRKMYKERREPLQKEKAELISNLKAGGRYVEGKVYKFVDREAKEVGFYDEDGFLVEQRRMTAADCQTVMKFSATGTED